jgi:rhomboid protease GluP
VVNVILGVTILVYLLQMASQAIYHVDLPAAYGMKVNDLILRGQIWRFFTPMFLHASLLHIGFNMYALYIFGRTLEAHYGHGRFLALYLVSGFAGNVMSFLFSQAPSLGASTAIFGLLAAEGMFLYQNKEVFGRSAQRALGNIITIAVINLIIGLSPGIDNWGHLGGLIGGALFSYSAGPVLRVQGLYPYLSLHDERSAGDAWRALLATGTLFALLAAVTIVLRTR